MSYDQWKTASPYDDDIDWTEYGAKCPKCNSDQFEVVSSDSDCMELDLECNDCSHKFIFVIPAECQSYDQFDEPQLSIFDDETRLTYDDPEIFLDNN